MNYPVTLEYLTRMMYLSKISLLSIVLFLPVPVLSGQEVLIPLSGLHSGTGLHGGAGQPSSDHGRLKVGNVDTLELPFFDDFSRKGFIPDQNIWTDQYVYINNSYAEDPVTVGVATLDAIYSDGSLNGDSKDPFPSDFLTSKSINLNYPGRNDVYLSFFYQPQGLGDAPERGDSLMVDFFDIEQEQWITVWSDTGRQSEDFRQVFIPVRDERFLKKGFRFRIKNLASLPKSQSYPSKNVNVDHWNIDYIYLDTARRNNITAVNDVAMLSSLGSLITEYEAIPWRHFKRAFTTHIQSRLPIIYRNNDTTARNVTRMLEITDLTEYKKEKFSEGAVNIQAGAKDTCIFSYSFPFIFYEADSVLFEMRSYLVTDELDYKWNDTIHRYQEFYNYYAYDDGSAELGYGLSGEGTINARVAYRFKSFEKDSLRGVQMYFNRILNDVGSDYLILGIWGHNPVTNLPGNLRYSQLGAKPMFGNELNDYKIYEFDSVLAIEDIFYVGWIKTTEDMLNLGFDRNIDNQDKIYYNLGQEWTRSSFHGSLMIRPLLGKEIVYPAASPSITPGQLNLYPNPAYDHIRIEPSAELADKGFTARIYNMQGMLVRETSRFENGIDLSSLPAGIYLLSLRNRSGQQLSRKFLIQK